MDQGNDDGVFDQAETAALQVIDLEAQQFGEKEEFVRHRESPEPINIDLSSARILGCCGRCSAAPYMVVQFYYGASGAGAATTKLCLGAVEGMGAGHVKKHMFDVAGLVQPLETLGEALDLVF